MADATNGGHGARAAGATTAGTSGPSAEPTDARERPIGELVKDLSSQTSTLVRKEIELARAEIQQKGKVAGKGAGMLAGAAVAGLLALGALTAALIALLDKAMATWVAALIVMALWAIVALVLAKSGQKALQRATPPAPQTVETVKEDIQWAKNPTGSVPR
jgi:Putative Actinobacterial Holin-X, holin superfamily III